MTGRAGLDETTPVGMIDTVQTAAAHHNARAVALRNEATGRLGPVDRTILAAPRETEAVHVALPSAGRAQMDHGSSVGSVPLQSQSLFFLQSMPTSSRRCWTVSQGVS